MSKDNKIFNKRIARRILSYTLVYKKLFYGALAITLALSVMAIVRPMLISYTLNHYIAGASEFSGLNKMCLLMASSLFLEAMLQVFNLRITNLLGQNIVRDLRTQVYKHVIHLKNAYFDKTPVGTIVTRTISDIESLSDMFSEGFIVITGDLLMLLVFMGAMFYNNWLLALLALSTIPLLFIATALFKRGVKKSFTMVRNAVSELNTFTQEHITGMKIVHLFNREKQEHEKFKAINQKHRSANIKSIFYYSVFFPVVDILSSVSIALIIWFSGVNNNTLHIGLGDITFFIMMVNLMFRPIRMLADRLNTLQMGIVSAERVFTVLDTNEKIETEGKVVFKQVNKSIELKNVWFAYKNDNYVLKDISFKINAGETVALVGATGAGKSTIINLLSRFYDFNNGDILIDDISIKKYDLESLRLNTGVVLQDVHLFNDSVLNNITLNNPEISIEQVIAATSEIGLNDFIATLPGGLNYQVTERGQSLSAGQRQLIAFIRAYVYKPSVFILDEATATIDTHTEQLIQLASEKIASGRTSVIIAHRLSTIKKVSRIFVFDNGKIVESGSIKELLALNGKFKKLYDSQFYELSLN
ncbi:MAG: ABC transporter ATP-binding protein [Bacteroidetes bacterium]|nr:ABC transporter ATP-binding protein [Bacteroidota bacterium]